MKFYSIQQLGPKRSLTPEGYLLCKDVPVARTGDMTYAPGEVPIAPGPDGLIHITRDADEVFHPDTLASCEGKSVTIGHPPEFVNAKNVRDLEVGSMMNLRRGDGIDADLMVADLLIKRQDGIDAVLKDGVEQVSLGYDADYQQVSPGRGVQRGILVNHVALVPRGRCGPRCEIGDEDTVMPTTPAKKPSWLDNLKAIVKDAEASESETEAEKEARLKKEKEEEEAAERKKTGDALSLILQKLTTLDEEVKELKKAKETDDEESEEDKDKKKTDDETAAAAESVVKPAISEEDVVIYTGDSAALIPARAEILAPGIKLPTFDSAKASTKDTAAHLCACQRRALAAAHKTDDGKAVLAPFVGAGTVDFDKMPPMAVNAIFTSAAEAMRARNNAGGGKGTTVDLKPVVKMSVTDSIRKMQENADKMWAGAVHSK